MEAEFLKNDQMDNHDIEVKSLAESLLKVCFHDDHESAFSLDNNIGYRTVGESRTFMRPLANACREFDKYLTVYFGANNAERCRRMLTLSADERVKLQEHARRLFNVALLNARSTWEQNGGRFEA